MAIVDPDQEMKEKIPKVTQGPVSYTHLDVYKRQEKHEGNR